MSGSSGSIALALNTQETGNAREQWVHLLPTGQFSGRDGRAWSISNPAAFITTTNRRQGEALPVDYEHQTDEATKNGQPAPAAGWIKELQPRPDGIWSRIEWTARAAAHIAAREYRFISPVFQYRADTREVTGLLRAGLTNNPNLELTALARAEHGADMDELQELQELLGLNTSATLADVVSSVRTRLEQTAANTPDPAKFVPMEVFEKAIGELNTRNQGMSEELAVNHVEGVMAKGQLIPFLKDWGVALCTRDRPAFDRFIASTGKNLQAIMGPRSDISGKPPNSDAPLSDVETAIARQLGHSSAEVIAANRRT